MWLTRLGIVALNSTVCRSRGAADRIASRSSANPMSSISSASSSTTVSTSSRRRLPRSIRSLARPGGRDDDVDPALEHLELPADRLAAVDGEHPRAEVAAVPVHRLRHLHGELAGRRQHQGARRGPAGPQPLQQRQGEGRGLAGAGRGLAEDVAARQHGRDGLALDRRRLLVPEGRERRDQLGPQVEVGEGPRRRAEAASDGTAGRSGTDMPPVSPTAGPGHEPRRRRHTGCGAAVVPATAPRRPNRCASPDARCSDAAGESGRPRATRQRS